jgi:hypothetical protein
MIAGSTVSSSRKGTPTSVLAEKRVAARSDVALEVSVLSGRRRVSFTVDNISTSGARLRGPLPLARGQRIRMVIGGESGAALEAEVVRVHTGDLLTDQVAVRFLSLTPEAEAHVHALVAQAGPGAKDADDEHVTERMPRLISDTLDAPTIRKPPKKPG